MSALSEQVRVALFNAMNVSAVTNLATGGVHHKAAPQSTTGAVVVFQRVTSLHDPTFGSSGGYTTAIEEDVWQIKAIADEDSDTSKEPEALCEDILDAVTTALPNVLTLSTGTCESVRKEGDIPDIIETINDRESHSHGFTLRIHSHA